ncbi:MAG: hypothetical protein MJ196_04550 [Treponemataceae bacterium]|nr:hypothetical protein [Treponemataceae bacterium]
MKRLSTMSTIEELSEGFRKMRRLRCIHRQMSAQQALAAACVHFRAGLSYFTK